MGGGWCGQRVDARAVVLVQGPGQLSHERLSRANICALLCNRSCKHLGRVNSRARGTDCRTGMSISGGSNLLLCFVYCFKERDISFQVPNCTFCS